MARILFAHLALIVVVLIVLRSGIHSLKYCAIHCDGLMSLEKSRLTDYVGELSKVKKGQLEKALQIALALPTSK